MVLKKHVQPVEDAKRDLQVDGHELFHTWPEHLHDHGPSVHLRPVHLSQARRGDRLALERVEELVHGLLELGLDDVDDLRGWIRRHLILQRADRGEVGLREDVGPRAQELRELDERRTEIRHRLGEAFGAL